MATVASPRRRCQAGRALSTATPGGTQALNPEGAISVPGSGLVNRWSDDKYRGRMRALLEAHACAKCELLSGELRAVNELVHGTTPLTERQRLRANGLLTKYAWAIPASSDNGYQPVCQTPGCDDPIGHRIAAAADELRQSSELEPEEAGTPVSQETPSPAARNIGSQTLSRISLDKIDRHPDNRVPSATAVADLAASIEWEGLLEPPVVRRSPEKPGRYQLISGETRILALRQLGRKGEIDAHVIACDSARALELLATYNAKRTDLTPIEKAQVLRRLMDPIAAGGGGMTSDQAAAVYGFETGAAARNLVRLLELPEIWQARVAAGDLPQTFARELLRVAHVAPVMAALDREFENWVKHPESFNDTFSSREDLVRSIDYEIDECTRPITRGHTYTLSDHKNGIPYGNYDCAFSVTEELREQLGVVTITTTAYKRQGRKRKAVTEEGEFATNVALYDKLQLAALKQKLAAKSKTASKNQADADERKLAAKPKPTAAELKARKAEQAKQLAARVQGWRHRFLCLVCAERITASATWPGLKFAIWMLGDLHHDIRTGWTAATGGAQSLTDGNYGASWSSMAKLATARSPADEVTCRAMAAVLCEIGAAYLIRADNDPRRPRIAFTVVDGLAADLGIDLAAEWRAAQAKDSPRRSHFEAFFHLFQSAQLDELGDDLGVFVANAKGREAKVRLFTNASRTLPLPACLRAPEPKAARTPSKKRWD